MNGQRLVTLVFRFLGSPSEFEVKWGQLCGDLQSTYSCVPSNVGRRYWLFGLRLWKVEVTWHRDRAVRVVLTSHDFSQVR